MAVTYIRPDHSGHKENDMTGHPQQFVIYKDKAGEFRWQLYAQNSKLIADSGEGYKNRSDCIHGARLVSSIAAGALMWDRSTQQWVE